jgi:signal transduction histidine kinase
MNQGAGKTGVGIAGMRERVRELGGYMAIKSGSQGTLLSVLLPVIQALDVSEGETQADTKVPAA